MTEEEILRKKLDWLNQNSYYGIMIDTEITSIVRNLIKRLEEKEMNATSTETFHDIIAVDFELQTFPNPDVQDKLIVSAINRDDIFAFVFEGPNIVDACKKIGLFTGWEKDQKIRELEEDLGRWKKEASDCLRLRDEAQKEAYKLKKENEKYEEKIKKLEHDDMLDKNAADYWSKEHDILLERFAKLQVENEKLKDKVEHVEPFRALEQTIREKHQLTEENENLKKHIKRHANNCRTIAQRNNELREELSLEKAANEAQRKFIREYAGKGTEVQFNYAIDDTEEVSYVIVEKRRNIIKENEYLRAEMKRLREENKDAVAESLKYIEINNKLRDENEELKYQLRDIQATKEVVEEKLNTRDNVNHPSHYTGRYECIDVMQDVFGDEATNDFCLCNAFKYIWRARKKNGLEDVKKAVWYLNKYIEEAEKDGVPKGK